MNKIKNKESELQGISLITICLNSSMTINETIDSIAAQKDDKIQYIIIDGGSTDGTQDIVRSYKSAVDYFISEPDQGISDAFNKGLQVARMDFVGLINSDDALLPGAIKFVRQALQENPGAEVFHGDLLFYDKAHFIKRIKPPGRWWYPWRLVLFNHPATFVKREVYQRLGGFDPAYRIAMDVEIFLRWLKAGVKIRYMPVPLIRMQGGGVSGKLALEGYREVKKALVHYGFSKTLTNIQYIARFIHCLIFSSKVEPIEKGQS